MQYGATVRLRHRLSSFIALSRMMGLRHSLLFAIYHLVTTPRFWYPFLVQRIERKRLAKAVEGLATYRCNDLVSVILPVNNGRSKGVERLVASLKAQTHKNIEFIAIDSGSTDDTVSYLRGEGWTVIQIDPQDFTHAYSRNTGAEQAKGRYLLFVVDDVVFADKDWLRSALFLLEKFGVDSLSSRQTVDGKADVYARVLDFFLASAQSDRPSINISRSNLFATYLRQFLPLRSQFHSVSIDDTNHLVKRDVFEQFKFAAPTVEDIDFALRLTRKGGRVLYTNLLSVIHYHQYDEESLAKYAKRVYIDTKVIAKWQPYVVKIPSRDSFLVGAFHALGLALRAIHLYKLNGASSVRAVSKSGKFLLIFGEKEYTSIDQSSRDDIFDVLDLMQAWDATSLKSIWLDQSDQFAEARTIFEAIVGSPPPSNLYYDVKLSSYFLARFREDVIAACNSLTINQEAEMHLNEFRGICLFLWCNRLMSHISRDDIFKRKCVRYKVDNLGIGDWT